MKIAYCKPCKAVIAAGALVGKPDPEKPSTLNKHVTGDGETHYAFLAEIAVNPMTPKEEKAPQKYLDRLAKEHASLFK